MLQNDVWRVGVDVVFENTTYGLKIQCVAYRVGRIVSIRQMVLRPNIVDMTKRCLAYWGCVGFENPTYTLGKLCVICGAINCTLQLFPL